MLAIKTELEERGVIGFERCKCRRLAEIKYTDQSPCSNAVVHCPYCKTWWNCNFPDKWTISLEQGIKEIVTYD